MRLFRFFVWQASRLEIKLLDVNECFRQGVASDLGHGSMAFAPFGAAPEVPGHVFASQWPQTLALPLGAFCQGMLL